MIVRVEDHCSRVIRHTDRNQGGRYYSLVHHAKKQQDGQAEEYDGQPPAGDFFRLGWSCILAMLRYVFGCRMH
jgi:hypothetical protein